MSDTPSKGAEYFDHLFGNELPDKFTVGREEMIEWFNDLAAQARRDAFAEVEALIDQKLKEARALIDAPSKERA